MRRNSLRQPTHDYTNPGLYFITNCTHRRARLFGEIHNGVMILNALGQVTLDEWLRTAAAMARIRRCIVNNPAAWQAGNAKQRAVQLRAAL